MRKLTFALNGVRYTLSDEDALARTSKHEPDAVRTHGVRLHGRIYPVKQALQLAIGVDRADYQSVQARSVFLRLGFEVVRLPG
jgi:hypothetical protein